MWGSVDVRSFNNIVRAVTLYRPFLSILIQKMEIETEIIKRCGAACAPSSHRAGGTQGTPIKYIGLGFLSYIFGVMPYRRRAYRRGRYGSRDKYSVHQKAFSFTAQASPTTTAQLIVPSSATEGMRKVKHLTVNLTPILDQDGGQIWWALVYVPQGTTAGSIQLATTAALSDMYEPNQYVMNCGIVDPTAGPIRFSSPISRNLNNGDAIVLLVRHTLGGNMDIRGTCRYAITLQ